MRITPLQSKLARTGLGLTTRALATLLKVTHTTVANFEQDLKDRISEQYVTRLQQYFESRKVFFGHNNGVSFGKDSFPQAKWFTESMFNLLMESDQKTTQTVKKKRSQKRKQFKKDMKITQHP